ncbi:MAG TPA: transglutaminase family protein [Burkholderiales bacterium]|nr:transglutaminase family protein [Burkholderiales bacterium]
MVRLKFSITLQYEIAPPHADFIFNIHAARTAHQQIVAEELATSAGARPTLYEDPATGTRHMRLSAPAGPLRVHYVATVDVDHHRDDHVSNIGEVPVAQLPQQVLPYVMPSRYCESDRLYRLANANFGHLAPGYGRVLAIRNWVASHLSFASATSNASTSAVDVLINRVGVCRDFAHVMIALCRALNLPARFATGIDYGADPALGPMDFHAYVEVYLGQRWYIFDPSNVAIPMGLLRIATGRDAADVAFATIFGTVNSMAPMVVIEASTGEPFIAPHHCSDALSTAA